MSCEGNKCSLHLQTLDYFCQKCYEPICKQCTILGPHNTQIHSIVNISAAYQRRVNQIRFRIAQLMDKNHQQINTMVKMLHQEIQHIKVTKELVTAENQVQKTGMVVRLEKCYEQNIHEINFLKEQMQSLINSINDLGHTFESIENPIEMIASHSNIISQIKNNYDKLQVLLGYERNNGNLPKELSDLRMKIVEIQGYQEILAEKSKIIKEILCRTDLEKKRIAKPEIKYAELFEELNHCLSNDIEHLVCHYCGIAFTYQRANTACQENTMSVNQAQFEGFCKNKPESTKWATHRHYFNQPHDPFLFYSQEDTQSSFFIHRQALFLKLKTLLKVKNIEIERKIEEMDRKRTGFLNKIAFDYLLMQNCGLDVKEAQILLSTCERQNGSYSYKNLVHKLSLLNI